MHGLKPGRDVEVVFTGARPGEKLHEQLAYDDEDMLETAHASVRQLKTTVPTDDHMQWMLQTFAGLLRSGNRNEIFNALHQAVPAMKKTGDRLPDAVTPAPPVRRIA